MEPVHLTVESPSVESLGSPETRETIGHAMHTSRRTPLIATWAAAAFVLSACGGSSDAASSGGSAAVEATTTSSGASDETSVSDDDETSVSGDDETSVPGGGVFIADFCAGGQPLNGAISLDDLVSFGFITSTDATVQGSEAYTASAYETFGFLCNISEEVGEGENFLTIGLSAGSDNWDLMAAQGDSTIEQMGDWEVIIAPNWLSPLTMRLTDAAGNQDTLFVTWTPADGSIPDGETLVKMVRPLAEAIASRSTVDIPRS